MTIKASNQAHLKTRALLDSGAEAIFFSRSLVRRLNLPVTAAKVSISSLGNKSIGIANGCVNLELVCQECPIPLKINALILRKLDITTPNQKVSSQTWSHIRDLNLADPTFSEPGPVEIIFGADVYGSLLLNGIRKGPRNTPVALRSVFGWVITCSSVSANNIHSKRVLSLNTSQDDKLYELLKRFWEQEEVENPTIKSFEDKECERLFIEGCRRHVSGRYIVRLPIRPNSLPTLGESLQRAKQMLNVLYNKWKRHPILKTKYSLFMSEYLSRGHMRLIPPLNNLNDSETVCYIPHHAVWRMSYNKPKV